MGADVTEGTAPRAVVERAFEALVELDLDGFARDFAPRITWQLPGVDYYPNNARWEGRETVIDDFLVGTFRELFDLDAPTTIDVNAIHGDGPSVVVELTLDGTTARGRHYFNHYCLVWTVEDGQVTSVREYTNTEYQKRILID